MAGEGGPRAVAASDTASASSARGSQQAFHRTRVSTSSYSASVEANLSIRRASRHSVNPTGVLPQVHLSTDHVAMNNSDQIREEGEEVEGGRNSNRNSKSPVPLERFRRSGVDVGSDNNANGEKPSLKWARTIRGSTSNILKTMSGGEEGIVSFDDVVSAKKRVNEKKQQAATRLELLPGSWALSVWRSLMVTIVAWTAVVAPVEIAFSWWDTPYIITFIGNLVDAFCILDMVLNFNVAYNHHGRLVTNHRAIAAHYVKSWFLPDLLINVPWNLILGDTAGSAKSRKVGKVLKLPKVFRLTRLLRVAREEAHYFGTAFAMAGIMLMAHYSACLWALLLIDCQEPGSCPNIIEAYAEGLSVGVASLGGADAWTRFMLTRSDSTSEGSHFIWDSSTQVYADLAAAAMSLAGFCALAMLFSVIAQAMERNDSHTRVFHERLWNLATCVQRHDIHEELVRRAKRHYHYLWSCGSDASRAILQDNALSADLRRQFAFAFYGDLLCQVPFLGSAQQSFIKQLCAYVEVEVFSPHDHIIVAGEAGTELYFIAVGKVTIEVPGTDEVIRSLDEGSFFGEMGLLFPETRCTVDVVGQCPGWLLVVPRAALEALCSDELLEAFRSVAMERFQYYLRAPAARETMQDEHGEAKSGSHRTSSCSKSSSESESELESGEASESPSHRGVPGNKEHWAINVSGDAAGLPFAVPSTPPTQPHERHVPSAVASPVARSASPGRRVSQLSVSMGANLMRRISASVSPSPSASFNGLLGSRGNAEPKHSTVDVEGTCLSKSSSMTSITAWTFPTPRDDSAGNMFKPCSHNLASGTSGSTTSNQQQSSSVESATLAGSWRRPRRGDRAATLDHVEGLGAQTTADALSKIRSNYKSAGASASGGGAAKASTSGSELKEVLEDVLLTRESRLEDKMELLVGRLGDRMGSRLERIERRLASLEKLSTGGSTSPTAASASRSGGSCSDGAVPVMQMPSPSPSPAAPSPPMPPPMEPPRLEAQQRMQAPPQTTRAAQQPPPPAGGRGDGPPGEQRPAGEFAGSRLDLPSLNAPPDE